jgi:ComF family protein
MTVRLERGMACGACAHGGARHFAWARAAGAFEGALREAIHRLKYDGRRRVGRVLGLWARETAGGVARPPRTPDIVAPVPLHWTRARQRGFNQSLLIAQGFVGGSGWRIEPHALRRVRRTRPQVDLDAEERATNVAGAFAVSDPDMVRGKRVLVVDDVLTTMHTVDECARVLVEAGAAAVHVVAVAR